MVNHIIDDRVSYLALKEYVEENNYSDCKYSLIDYNYVLQFDDHEHFLLPISGWDKETYFDLKSWLNTWQNKTNIDTLVFGKNDIKGIVSCEVHDHSVELFIEDELGVNSTFLNNHYWIVANKSFGEGWTKLNGSLHYCYIKYFDNANGFYKAKRSLPKDNVFLVNDPKEASMILNGYTYYKGLKVQDVSVLSFDIESTGLGHNQDSRVLLISNTYRKGSKVLRKLFAHDDYEDDAQMFNHWCSWVKEINPSIILGHNIFLYDLPYMAYCASKAGVTLSLGRDNTDLKFSPYESKFRFDGSQDYDYKRAYIYGREIVDTMFLSMKFDFSRKYENYRLKQIIKQEGLEIANRQFYDAGTIHDHYKDPIEWVKIKKYAEHDADDALALFDLMIPAYFYYSQSIPKPFQSVMYSASGSQINAFLIRSYLQDGYSVPCPTPEQKFEGAISLGNPGVYHNVFKIDVASLYPSIMLQYNVYDKDKDPKQHFSKMVSYFTEERLRNKKLGKETNDRYYKELEQAQKIVINSAYGMLGAPGLMFNSPSNAALVTTKGREVLSVAIQWAEQHGYQIVNADTDSISIVKNNQVITQEERHTILQDVNSLYPEKIHFEDDGYYTHCLVIKTKNYVLDDGKKLKVKGSALKASTKEKALKLFIDTCIKHLFNNDNQALLNEYNNIVKEIYNLQDISKWCSRKTITEAVLNPERLNEQKVADAIENEGYQMGDKVWMYYDTNKALKLQDKWNADHDKESLLKKLHNTIKIFSNVVDVKLFPNYTLKRNKLLLENLLKGC